MEYDTVQQMIAQKASSFYYQHLYDSSAYFYAQLNQQRPEKYEIAFNYALALAASGNQEKSLLLLESYVQYAGDKCHCSFFEENEHFQRYANHKKFIDLGKQCRNNLKKFATKEKTTNYLLSDKIQYYLGKDQEILNNPLFLNGLNTELKNEQLHSNLMRALRLIDTTRLPTLTEVGTAGTGALSILFLHADYLPNFQLSMGKKMMALGGEQGYSKKNAAYLIDRAYKNLSLPQLYGTILEKNPSGKYELYRTDNLEEMKKRRLELGFQAIEDYLHNLQITK